MPLVDGGTGGSLLARVGAVRRQVAADLGAVIPPVRIHDDVALGSHEYVMKVRGNEVARGSIMAGHQLALDPGDAVGQLAGIPTTEPAFGLPAVWIPDPARAEAEALGYTVVDAESVIVTHLTETIRSHVAELLTRQDVRALLDRLKESNAAVVEEVVPDLLSVGEIQRVLQSLLREGVSIRDLGAIVEVVGDRARVTRDPVLLAEYARQALGRAIVMPHVDSEQRLRAISLDPADRAGDLRLDRPDGRRRVPRHGARPARTPSSARWPSRPSTPSPAAGAPSSSAARACAATCAASSSRTCPSCPSAPTTRSHPASASRPSESCPHEHQPPPRPSAPAA